MEATSRPRQRGRLAQARIVIPTSYTIMKQWHCQDWTLFRCFDSKVELSESEDEVTYNQRLEAELDGVGTSQALLLGYNY